MPETPSSTLVSSPCDDRKGRLTLSSNGVSGKNALATLSYRKRDFFMQFEGYSSLPVIRQLTLGSSFPPRRMTTLVFGGMVNTVDNDDLYGTFGGDETEA
jgi:hypothetical protein